MPRTMTESREAAARYTAANLPYSAGNELMKELDAERAVSKALAEALANCQVTVSLAEAALELYRESKP